MTKAAMEEDERSLDVIVSVARGLLLESLAGKHHLFQDKNKHIFSYHHHQLASETLISGKCPKCVDLCYDEVYPHLGFPCNRGRELSQQRAK